MKHISRYVGKLNIIEKMKNSTNGNARFKIFIADKNGNGVGCVTKPNSSYADDVKNLEGKIVEVTIGVYRGEATLDSIRKAVKTKYGTAHFASIVYAQNYYGSEAARKIKEGEIFIGTPKLKEGQTLLINNEGRYVIEGY